MNTGRRWHIQSTGSALLGLKRTRWVVVLGTLALITAACGAATPTKAPSSKANAGGAHPNLAGDTITIATGSSPQVSDTNLSLLVQVLSSWGANATLVNETGAADASTVVLAGSADIAEDPVSTVADAKLEAFGPNDPRVDYRMMGAPGITSAKKLVGKIFGVSNLSGTEALMLGIAEKHFGITPSSVHVQLSGGQSVRAAAMLTGQLQGTFESTQGYLELKSHGFHSLVTMSSIAPLLADTYLAAEPKWISGHAKEALAVNEAWIKVTNTFLHNENAWVNAAVAYTGSSIARSLVVQLYNAYRADSLWTDSASSYDPASAAYNVHAAASIGAFTGPTPSVSSLFTFKYWNEATKALNVG